MWLYKCLCDIIIIVRPIIYFVEGRVNQIARVDRKCLVWDSNDIGDEYHYICLCPKFDEIRKNTLKKDLIRNPSVKKICDLFSMRNKTKLTKLALINDKSDSK